MPPTGGQFSGQRLCRLPRLDGAGAGIARKRSLVQGGGKLNDYSRLNEQPSQLVSEVYLSSVSNIASNGWEPDATPPISDLSTRILPSPTSLTWRWPARHHKSATHHVRPETC